MALRIQDLVCEVFDDFCLLKFGCVVLCRDQNEVSERVCYFFVRFGRLFFDIVLAVLDFSIDIYFALFDQVEYISRLKCTLLLDLSPLLVKHLRILLLRLDLPLKYRNLLL